MTLATLCWMVAGCADEVIDRNGGKGEGRLLLTGIEDLLVEILITAGRGGGLFPACGRVPGKSGLWRGGGHVRCPLFLWRE